MKHVEEWEKMIGSDLKRMDLVGVSSCYGAGMTYHFGCYMWSNT